MDRKNPYEKYKLAKASTNKVGFNIYLDAFEIEKVRIQLSEYEGEKRSISYYVDFEDWALLATDVGNGNLIRKLQAEKQYKVAMGGTEKSENYNGSPESRIFSLGWTDGKDGKGPKIFINLTRGKGKLTETHAIAPDGAPDVRLNIGLEVNDFRKIIILADYGLRAYMASMVNKLVAENSKEKQARKEQTAQ